VGSPARTPSRTAAATTNPSSSRKGSDRKHERGTKAGGADRPRRTCPMEGCNMIFDRGSDHFRIYHPDENYIRDWKKMVDLRKSGSASLRKDAQGIVDLSKSIKDNMDESERLRFWHANGLYERCDDRCPLLNDYEQELLDEDTIPVTAKNYIGCVSRILQAVCDKKAKVLTPEIISQGFYKKIYLFLKLPFEI